MKKFFSCVCAALLLCVFVQPGFAADSLFSGTWKLNVDKSKLTGDTFIITALPGGMMHFVSGSSMSYDFACDGKPHAILADRTVTCTGSPETGYDYTTMAGTAVLAKSHRSFSPDGTMLMMKGTQMNADGTTTDYEDTYKRESGSKGLVGKWISVKAKTGSDAMKIAISGDTIHVEWPSEKGYATAKLDGTFAPVMGPNIPPGAMASYKASGPAKMHWVNKYKDKVLAEGTQTVAADGKTITEEVWEAGKYSERATLIWEKQ